MILIGSRALNHYVPLERKMHDWDFLMTREEHIEFHQSNYKNWVKTTNYSHIYDIDGEIVEIRNPEFLDPTDWELIFFVEGKEISTPFGDAEIPNLQLLYDIKKSTYECVKEHKHKYDLELIEKNSIVFQDTDFYSRRLAEIQVRTKVDSKNKYDFFHKYHIPEYIIHDRLHEMIADLLDLSLPTYVRTIIGSTETCPDLYNKLTHEQKVSLMVEESLVLSLERWFIPQMIENGINYKLIDMFYNNNEAMPTYHILKHVNLVGLKGEADYVVNFGKENFFEIEKGWIKAKETIRSKGGFPNWFFNELFELRDKYRNGEKTALV
jgi:hypothetical protein